jgi:hypothetical protein
LTYLQAVSISPVMLSLMKMCFLSLPFILMPVHSFERKFFFFLPILLSYLRVCHKLMIMCLLLCLLLMPYMQMKKQKKNRVKTVKIWPQMTKIPILEKKTNWARTLTRIYLGPRLPCRLIPRRIFARLPKPRCPLRHAPTRYVCTHVALGPRRGTRHEVMTTLGHLQQACGQQQRSSWPRQSRQRGKGRQRGRQ